MRETRRSALTHEEAIGLALAIGAHVALIAALTLSPLGRKVQPPPPRMTVSIADTVADQSVSPKPDAQPAPDSGQQLGEPAEQPQPVVAPAPQPEPKPVARPQPKPEPKPAPEPKPVPKPEPQPKPKPKPEPKPVAKPEPKPEPKAPAKPVAKPKPQPKAEAKPDTKAKTEAKDKAEAKEKAEAKQKADARAKADAKAKADLAQARADAKSAAAAAASHPKSDRPLGHSRIGSDFLKGIAGVTSPGTDKVSPGDKAGAIPAATVVSLISRQIKPHWSAPQGADAEKLVTVVGWSLSPDGKLAGTPTVISQSGITDANRAQARIHAEQAIRAVRLAAPFQLPAQAYAQFSRFEFRFDRKLSQ